jgi:hypothetical protein
MYLEFKTIMDKIMTKTSLKLILLVGFVLANTNLIAEDSPFISQQEKKIEVPDEIAKIIQAKREGKVLEFQQAESKRLAEEQSNQLQRDLDFKKNKNKELAEEEENSKKYSIVELTEKEKSDITEAVRLHKLANRVNKSKYIAILNDNRVFKDEIKDEYFKISIKEYEVIQMVIEELDDRNEPLNSDPLSTEEDLTTEEDVIIGEVK